MASHEMKIRVMKTVSPGTREIIRSRVRNSEQIRCLDERAALAMVHGDVCDMIYASDLAQKTSSVEVFEIPGSCPQHMTCLGICGDVSAVEVAVQRIRNELLEGRKDHN
ncbi:MAG: BMC domain-containing protein [Dorea sp.]